MMQTSAKTIICFRAARVSSGLPAARVIAGVAQQHQPNIAIPAMAHLPSSIAYAESSIEATSHVYLETSDINCIR
jgi:hypothetical protein